MIAPLGCHNARNRGIIARPTPRASERSELTNNVRYEHLLDSFLLLSSSLLPTPPYAIWDSYLFSLKNDVSLK